MPLRTVSETATQRLNILTFWSKHALAATLDAFGVGRRTLYPWKAAYHQGQDASCRQFSSCSLGTSTINIAY